MIINSGLIGTSSPEILWSGTVSGLKISSVDGAAFVDGLPAAIIALIGRHPGNLWFDTYDSAGRLLRGVLSAAGTAETLDAELFSTTDFSGAGWLATGGWSTAGGAATHDGSAPVEYVYQAIGGVIGYLHKISCNITVANSGSVQITAVADAANIYSPNYNTTGVKSFYFTKTGGSTGMGFSSNTTSFNGSITTPSYKVVLTPSSSGAVIVSAKGGATQNFSVNQWVAESYTAAENQVIVRALR